LLAGANWNNGTNSGSRSRNANNYRWNTNTNIGSQFASDTGCANSRLDLLTLFSRSIEQLNNEEAKYKTENLTG
jgi:hypothetical protein